MHCAIEYIVERRRFDIFEDVGCLPVTYVTPLAFVLFLCWPLAIDIVSAVYGCKLYLLAHLNP